MILCNGNKLDVSILNDPSKKGTAEYLQAKFYKEKVDELRETYGKQMRVVDTNQPRTCKGADSRGVDIPNMKEPDTMVLIPLERYYADPERGREKWSCCLSTPKLLPNNMWDLGDKRSLTIKGDKIIDLTTDADLAFYLTYIHGGIKKKKFKIDDPKLTARQIGDKRREAIKRETAIWQMLTDDDKLKTIAQAYGVPDVYKKEPDNIRVELEKLLEVNDKRKKQDRSVRGTAEFLEELKFNDAVILRAFVQNAIDDKVLTWKPDGWWRVGEKLILKVPQTDLDKKFDYICNFLNQSNNADKLQDFVSDIVGADYVKKVKDDNTFKWLAKVNSINTVAKSKDQIRELVREHYGVGEDA